MYLVSCRWTEEEKKENDFCKDGVTLTGRDGLTYCHSNAEDAEEEEVQCVADDECECGPVHWQQGDQQRIVGGGIAPEHAYPWQISIFRNITEYMTKVLKFMEDSNILQSLPPGPKAKAKKYQVPSHTCGGSIISTQFILTAAHCVDPFELSEYFPIPEDLADKIPADMLSYTVTAENLLVVAGEHKIPNQITSTNQVENDNNIHRVKEIINHKKYYRNYYWRKTALECTVKSSCCNWCEAFCEGLVLHPTQAE